MSAWFGGICTPPYGHIAPCMSVFSHMAICLMYICMSPTYHYVPHMSWGLGGICTPHMSWGLFGYTGTSVRHFFVYLPSLHSCSPSLWVAWLLDLMPMDVCYASCCWLVLSCSVFILSGVSATMAMTTTPPESEMCLQAYASYTMGLPQVGFSFRVEPSTIFLFTCVGCLLWCILSAFRCHAGCCIHLWGLTHWDLHHCSPLELTHGSYMFNLIMVIGPHQECTEWLCHPLPWVGGAFFYSLSCPLSIPTIWWGIQLWELGRESPNPSTFPEWWEGVFCSRFGSIQWHSQLWICGWH